MGKGRKKKKEKSKCSENQYGTADVTKRANLSKRGNKPSWNCPYPRLGLHTVFPHIVAAETILRNYFFF